MIFTFQPMNQKDAEMIVNWHYEDPYSFYDMKADPEDLEEFLDSTTWDDKQYVVYDENRELIGFISFTKEGETVEIGLGLRPDLTGTGIGHSFLEEGMAFAREKFSPQMFKLSVAAFNERAIKVYERVGFRGSKIFMQETNGGEYEFLEMVKEE